VTSMDKKEASDLLDRELAKYERLSHADAIKLFGDVQAEQVTGASGADYTTETELMWDGAVGGDILVISSIDDGGLSSFSPMTRDVIIAKPE